MDINNRHIDNLIVSTQSHVFDGTKHVVVLLQLKNGEFVSGESTASSLEGNHLDQATDRARTFARNKLWALERYALASANEAKKG